MSGRVLDAAGRPVAGAAVAVESSSGPVPDLAAATAPDGGFRLSRLPAGSVLLVARREALRGSSATEVVGGSTVTVEIRIS